MNKNSPTAAFKNKGLIPVTPLEAWISRKIHGTPGLPLTREDIARYQIKRVNETIERVKRDSRFYREHLKHIPDNPIKHLSDMATLPFTTFEDISNDPMAFSCVSQTKISRVTSVPTSGTTGGQKRIFFTPEDQEATTDFFHHGMANLADLGDRVLILLPGELPGSVGDLLFAALARLGAQGYKYGFVDDPERVIAAMDEYDVNVLVGVPVQVLSLVRGCKVKPKRRVKSVLLTTDYVPAATLRAVEEAWGCRVFNHYGATEMGLGGGVQCKAFRGYHLREADMLFEIVDPDTGEIVPDNEYGEVVFTSLTAVGTPFVRYRTGDISRIIKKPCPCGTVLKTLDIVSGRTAGRHALPTGHIMMRDFDEALFALDDVLDFEVNLYGRHENTVIDIGLKLAPDAEGMEPVYAALYGIKPVKEGLSKGSVSLGLHTAHSIKRNGAAKRIIYDRRESSMKAPEGVKT
ncbi:MAG: DVU_1553 family AMP-dependent CoA ligase [Burkholderiales bacterium]